MGKCLFMRKGETHTDPFPIVPADLQFLETVLVNGEAVQTATGYDTVEYAIKKAVVLPVPSTTTTTISYSTLYAIQNGNVTTTRAYSNFNVYSSKTEAMAFTQAAVPNGGAEKSFSGIDNGYYLMIATENFGAVQYYAYVFKEVA